MINIKSYASIPYCHIIVAQKCPVCKKERSMMYFTSFSTYKDLENKKITPMAALDKTIKEKSFDEVMLDFLESGTCFKCQKKRYGRKLSNETKFCIVN